MKDPVGKGTLCWLHRRSVPITNITDGSAISFSSSNTHKGGSEIVSHAAVFPPGFGTDIPSSQHRGALITST